MYRENIFGCELIWGEYRYMFPNKKGKRSMKDLFIFSMVRRDAINYLKKHRVKDSGWVSSITYNPKADVSKRKMIGTDIDGAYWSIAYKMGIISENTYNRGLLIKEKHLLLASLSSLGRDKRYTMMSEGKFTGETVIIKGNDQLKLLYKKIRYKCFGYMKKLARMIGNDFVAYKTDCIYYLHSLENISIVKSFLDSEEIDFKMVRDYNTFGQYAED